MITRPWPGGAGRGGAWRAEPCLWRSLDRDTTHPCRRCVTFLRCLSAGVTACARGLGAWAGRGGLPAARPQAQVAAGPASVQAGRSRRHDAFVQQSPILPPIHETHGAWYRMAPIAHCRKSLEPLRGWDFVARRRRTVVVVVEAHCLLLGRRVDSTRIEYRRSVGP